MEFASRLRWFLIILAMILVLVFVGWGLFAIAKSTFGGNNSSSSVASNINESVVLTNQARMYVDGPVVAESLHRSYGIEVNSSVVTMKVYGSYGQRVLRERSYRNTPQAYEAFLNSLVNLRITSRVSGTTTEDDDAESGVCSAGRRYIVELDDSIRRWSTSCESRPGTAAFSMTAVRRLFRNQVPDFSELVDGIEY